MVTIPWQDFLQLILRELPKQPDNVYVCVPEFSPWYAPASRCVYLCPLEYGSMSLEKYETATASPENSEQLRTRLQELLNDA